MAGFNYGYHRKKMEDEFLRIASVCREEGLSEDTIECIHRMLLDEINSNRRFYTHTQSYNGLEFTDGNEANVDNNPLLKKYLERFSVTQGKISDWDRISWIEDIGTPELTVWVKSLCKEDILLLTLIIIDGMKQTEIAKLLKKHDSAISRKMKQFRKSLEKVLPDYLKKEYGI